MTYSQDRINPRTGQHFDVDYTGFASGELKRYFAMVRPRDASLEQIAQRIGISSTDLRRLVTKPDVEFVGLGMTDRIFIRGMGLSISDGVNSGQVRVIPNANRKHARWMAEDEFWADEIEPNVVQLIVRTGELIRLREKVLEEARSL